MAYKYSELMRRTFRPPVMEARRWIENASPPDSLRLLNLSQAAPVDPPPEPMLDFLARQIVENPDVHVYGPDLGFPELREEIATQWSDHYRGTISSDQVAVTSGCNQAFCAAVAAVARPGDAVILPTPWYFNHKMHLDMAGIEARLLPCSEDMTPSVERAKSLIDDRTRAIVLVTPNNPTGAEYSADLISDFAELARNNGLALILDETYRDFHSADGPPHTLFQDPDWADVLIHLYSFSKVFRLTGHRVGAMIGSSAFLSEVEKYLDTVTICANQLGQRAALFGLQHLSDWVAGERAEILSRRECLRSTFKDISNLRMVSSGAYFAFFEHTWKTPSNLLAEALVAQQNLLVLPGTMFAPTLDTGGEGSAERQFRVAFANADADGIKELHQRLLAFDPTSLALG